jgi:hypothetical protein
MKKQIVGSLIAITAAILISGCSDKNEEVKKIMDENSKNIASMNMAQIKGKSIYVSFEANDKDLKITSTKDEPLNKEQKNNNIQFNEINKDTNYRKDCVCIERNKISKCTGGQDKYDRNSFYVERTPNAGGIAWGIIASPVLLSLDILDAGLNGKTDLKETTISSVMAPREFNNDLLIKTGIYLNNKIYEQYQKTIADYKNSTTAEEKKRYEEEYYKFVNLENAFSVKIISKEGKALNVNDDVGLNGLITNTQANGTLKLQAKIGLNPNNKYDIPVKYGTHTFKVRFDFLLKYRISGMGISMDQDETISRVAMVTLSPNNNYSTIINVDFGKYVQSSQSKLLLFSGGQQVIGTKLNVEFEDE